MPGPLRSFHAFDDTTKKSIEFLFLKKFRYCEGEDPVRCRHVLHAIVAKRLTEELPEARHSLFKRFGYKPQVWKQHIPHWCLDDPNWHGLCDIFATEAFKDVSKANKENRIKSGRKIAHHGGSASAHQHFAKMTKLNNGKEPPMRALYIHLHCAKEKGKSPIVARLKATEDALQSGPSSINDADGVIDGSRDEANTQLEALDINSLQFTNDETQAVYQRVNDMRATQDVSDMDESNMFLASIGRPKNGRIPGFGCMFDDKINKANKRNRANGIPCHNSGLTTTGEDTNLSRTELQALLAESDCRYAEERVERKRELAQYDFYIKQLFTMMGSQVPTTQGLSCPTPNLGGPFTALLNQAGNDEIATDRAEMDPWFGQSGFNVNRPFYC